MEFGRYSLVSIPICIAEMRISCFGNTKCSFLITCGDDFPCASPCPAFSIPATVCLASLAINSGPAVESWAVSFTNFLSTGISRCNSGQVLTERD